VRIGNLMNSEAYGIPTSFPWGFMFILRQESFARHPAQLYESVTYLVLFLWLYNYHRENWQRLSPGYVTGLSLTTVFAGRFIIEFMKDSPSVTGSFIQLNMGQVLSLPMIILGVTLLVLRRKKIMNPMADDDA